MSALLALAAGAAAVTAPAQPGLTGLWEGTVGKYPVMVCLRAEGSYSDRGSYYYRSQLIPIRLERNDEKAAEWKEGFQDDRPKWTMLSVGENRLKARWTDGKKTLPVELTRKEFSASNDWADGPCASPEYMAPRLFERQVATRPARLGDWEYRVVEWKPPRHFAENSFSTIEFDPVEPGDREIVERLRDVLPDGTIEGDFIQCMIGNLSWHGVDGDMGRWSEPAFVNRNFISLSTGNGNYCGGAHPNFWQDFTTYDRQSGELIDPGKRWFTTDGFANTDYDSWIIQPALRDVVLRYYSADQEEECRWVVGESSFWDVGLQSAGLVFLPSVAHAAKPCAEAMIVPWDELEPFLSEERQQARMRAKG